MSLTATDRKVGWMNKVTIFIIIWAQLITAALADGAPVMLSVLLTGGPVAPILASYWGVRGSTQLSTRNRRWCAGLCSSPMAFIGYYLGGEFAVRQAWIVDSILGILVGPLALGCAILAGQLPRMILSSYETKI